VAKIRDSCTALKRQAGQDRGIACRIFGLAPWLSGIEEDLSKTAVRKAPEACPVGNAVEVEFHHLMAAARREAPSGWPSLPRCTAFI
jgi:hypothetical protein